jgi:hypothetical protein
MSATEKKEKKKGAYTTIILEAFFNHYKEGQTRFVVTRPELLQAAQKHGIKMKDDDDERKDPESPAKNIGDVVYTFRFRRQFPKEIRDTAPAGKMWIILGAGDARYEFRLITTPKLDADPGLFVTKVHDATPQIVLRFSLNDEQAILARVRYNRLIDLFCKCVAYSLQNHLRTKIKEIGQLEIDELYVGSNRQGEHFIIPVQVKREKDKLGVSQLIQDLEYCALNHPALTARAIGAQSIKRPVGDDTLDLLALFEFECQDTGDDIIISKRAERHFQLLPYREITEEDFLLGKKRKDAD